MGAHVTIADLDSSKAHQVAANITACGPESLALTCDVTDPDAADAMVAAAVAHFGRVDIAVNNAGIGISGTPTAEISPEHWRRVMNVNLDGVFYCMRAELPRMAEQGGGSIINITSIMASVGSPAGSSAYTASKHGVLGLTKNAALEYARQGIRVNAVGPGYVMTPLVEQQVTNERLQELAGTIPTGRLASPDEIAPIVAWLGSDAARYVTGAYYAVDGGYLAR